jgi:hypothetical protein
MAKKRNEAEVYVEKPKPDVYLAILILTFVAMLVATVLMYLEFSNLPGS